MEIKWDVHFWVRIIDVLALWKKIYKPGGTIFISTEPMQFTFDKGGVTICCMNNTARIVCTGLLPHIVECEYKTQIDGYMLNSFSEWFEDFYSMRSIDDNDHPSKHYFRFFYSRERNESFFCCDSFTHDENE